MIYWHDTESRSGVPEMIDDLNLPNQRRKVKVGDYVIIGNIIVCIERKDAMDLIMSIADNTFNNQLYAMSYVYDRSFLVIEGSITEACYRANFDIERVYSAMADVSIMYNPTGKSGLISIIPAETKKGTVSIIKNIFKRITADKGLIRTYIPIKMKGVGDDLIVVGMMRSIPGVGKGKAETLIRAKGSFKKVVNSTLEELIAIKGIGESTALEVLTWYEKEVVLS